MIIYTSLKEKIVGRMLFFLGIVMLFISSASVAMNIILINNNFRREVDSWVLSFPKRVLPNLIDSDYIGANAKASLIKSASLFSFCCCCF